MVDLARRRVRLADREVELTTTEFDLLAYLTGDPGRVFSRGHLLEAVWQYQSAVSSRTVDVHVGQLRAKLGPGCPIRTVRGVGYGLEG